VEEVEKKGDGGRHGPSSSDDDCLGVFKVTDPTVKFLDLLLLLLTHLEERVELSLEASNGKHDVVFCGHQAVLTSVHTQLLARMPEERFAVVGAADEVTTAE
jgi:hypothetical protein